MCNAAKMSVSEIMGLVGGEAVRDWGLGAAHSGGRWGTAMGQGDNGASRVMSYGER